MIDTLAVSRLFAELNLEGWFTALKPLIDARLSASTHRDVPRWEKALDRLHDVEQDPAALRETLLELVPWRKGPFEVGGVTIDAEWRSDLKWSRIADAVDLTRKNVLDVGCGNGYYALKMRDAGAMNVIGVDPTIVYVLQFLAVNHFKQDSGDFVLPLRVEELPLPAKRFDTTFSMGVLYHQRSPIEHLRQLRQTLRAGGQLVLETIFVPGEESYACTPADRYARMKNVWLLPTLAELETWLKRTGYRDIEIVDESTTTTDEQRTTEWMPYESLAEALDPERPGRTIEGWPAPRRVVVTATSP